MKTKRATTSARQRILETAERLFYRDGIRAVGIDRIIAEAEVAKMTLYNHFSSKDELILAVLQYREAQVLQLFQDRIDSFTKTGMNRLEAFFATLKEWFASKNFRGCSFINASVELADPSHPAAIFASRHKQKFQQLLTEVVVDVKGKQAISLVPAIALLVEGAIVTAVMEGNADSAEVAQQAVSSLLANTSRAK